MVETCICAILDTGACNNFLSKSLFDELSTKNRSLKLRPVKTWVISASGDKMYPLGEVVISVKIDRFSWPVTFQVIDGINSPCILGIPFFSKTRAVVDFEENQMYFKFQPSVRLSFCQGKNHIGAFPSQIIPVVREPVVPVDLSHLTESQQTVIHQIIDQFPHVLNDTVGLTSVLEHTVRLTDSIPVRTAPYKLSPVKSRALQAIVDKMLHDGVI